MIRLRKLAGSSRGSRPARAGSLSPRGSAGFAFGGGSRRVAVSAGAAGGAGRGALSAAAALDMSAAARSAASFSSGESSRGVPSELNGRRRSEEHTSELQSPDHLVCRLLLEKKKKRRHNKL